MSIATNRFFICFPYQQENKNHHYNFHENNVRINNHSKLFSQYTGQIIN